MAGQNVGFPSNGSTCQGFLSSPEAGDGPGVVVLQEWWGLVGHIRDVCDRFAEAGFVALSPDLYHGESARSPDAAGKLMMALDIDQAERDMRGAIDYLLGLDTVSGEKAGVVGFCMGGQLALYAACANDRIGACVDYYGIHPAVRPDFANLKAPVLGFFAENDEFVPPPVARQLEADLTAAGKEVEIHIYEGADHAFFNDARPEVYHESYAADSWRRMLALFRAELAP